VTSAQADIESPGAPPASPVWRWVNLPFIALLWLYRLLLGPLMGGKCRFVPTCSRYALDAYRAYDPIRATWLTARRLIRCHPWGGSGYDPVPPGND
jgi:putative membrane protein insertion efficiency factor